MVMSTSTRRKGNLVKVKALKGYLLYRMTNHLGSDRDQGKAVQANENVVVFPVKLNGFRSV